MYCVYYKNIVFYFLKDYSLKMTLQLKLKNFLIKTNRSLHSEKNGYSYLNSFNRHEFCFRYTFFGILTGFIIAMIVFFKFAISDVIENNYIYRNEEKVKIFTKENSNYFKKSQDKNFKTYGIGEDVITLSSNDNLFNRLIANGYNQQNVAKVTSVFNKKINASMFKKGTKFKIKYSYTTSLCNVHKENNVMPIMEKIVKNKTITEISFKEKGIKYLIKNDKNNDYILCIEKQKLTTKTRIINGIIKNNLFTDAIMKNIKASTVANILNEYMYLIDFQRDLHKNDKFVFILEVTEDEDGQCVKERVMYSNLILHGKKHEIFNFEGKFYDRSGKSVQKNLLKTPIDGARITSNFSLKRKHPILGYTRAHTGIDMAAPTGTPIYAAGNGVVAQIKYKDYSYGNFVLIKHNSDYSTKYAHMSRIAHIKIGQKIKQKQVIGYVGMTGLATGPHLHYEVIYRGKHVNPRKVQAIEVEKIGNNKIQAYKKNIANIDQVLKNKKNNLSPSNLD